MKRKTRKGMRTMEIFGKRIGYRLSGGVATILLGAFAAAQAQQSELPRDTDLADQNVPALDAPRWQSEMPSPISMPTTDDGGPMNFLGAYDDSSDPGTIQQTGYSDETFVSQPVEMASHNEPAAGPTPLSMPEPATQSSEPQDAGPSMTMSAMEMPASIGMGMPPMDQPEDASAGSMPEANLAMPEADLSMPGGFGMPDMSVSMTTPEQPQDAGPAMNMQGMSFGDMPADPQAGGNAPNQPIGPPAAGGFANEAPSDIPANDMRMPEPMQMPDDSLPNLPAPQSQAAANMEPPADATFGGMNHNGPSDMGYDQPNQFGQPEPMSSNGLRSAPAPTAYGAPDQFAGADQPYAGSNQPGTSDQFGSADQFGSSNASAYGANTNNTAPGYNNPSPAASTRFASQRELPGAGYAAPGANNGYGGNQSIAAQPTAFSMPGERRLEGMQTPSIVIHKEAPPEVKVGQPATFKLNVQNVGTAEALGVRVHDTIPAGMRFNDASGNPVMQGDALTWELGSLPAGEQRIITMNLTPVEEGELGSIARVTFEAAASVRTRSTRPELKVTQHAPAKVLIGQQLEIELEVSNVGSGAATNVVLREDVPEGMDHPGGRELDSFLSTLRPGEVRREVLRMRAVEPGLIRNTVHLVSDDAEPTSHTVEVEVVAPEIDIRLTGPGLRFLERQATYEVELINRGTAPATNVEIIARLDRGFTFVSTENAGYYDPNRHAVLWSVASLPPGKPAKVPLTLLPVEEGEQAIQLEATADLNSRATSESTVRVESQSELSFSISDLADPIEQGAETTYEIRLQNSGSRNDSNVQVRLMVPPGMEVLGSDAEVRPDGQGGMVFAPEQEMPAGSERTYRIRVRGVTADTHLVKAIVTSDQSPKPVTKEESTMVYADH
ncbi:60 kDa outer membrane protein [Rhodopirellula islandica]|uniref:60 kDa outer membrane protein n=1 Tax=Rhodopirellula islandica TaxID=595434 RepID=A0A0J1E7R5_RHOIS|nr:DUF11 domain-containing protein [Rhodopirellula islandica]KLU01529.1 60 kDa outer membrane protein [Rhodopirellula islandica]